MPLARYELRSEWRFANPELYKAVPKNDPKALFESITMAALAGIVRQLGEVAELAAEIFNGLHEEVLALSSRGRKLAVRVEQLEAELPTLEDSVYCDVDQLRHAFTHGLQWHPPISVQQNHFSQAELPRFIQRSYDDCRGPPQFYLLDNFDVKGPGATLKRYSDPSFFRFEWANSELLKAEKAQAGRHVRRGKKREGNSFHGVQQKQTSTPEDKISFIEASKFIHSVDALTDPALGNDRSIAEIHSLQSKTLRISAREIESSMLKRRIRHPSTSDSDPNDGAEHFVDALTILEPEAENESGKIKCSSTSSPTSSGSNDEAACSVGPIRTLELPGRESIQEVVTCRDEQQQSPFNVQGATELSFYSSSSPSEISSQSLSPSLSDLSEESYSSQQVFNVLDSPVVSNSKGNTAKDQEIWALRFAPNSPSMVKDVLDEAPPPPPLPPSKWRVVKAPLAEEVLSVPMEDVKNGEPVVSQCHDKLMDSIVSHDRDTLRKVSSDCRAKSFDNREVLLEQIRSRSFNLKHATQQEKERSESPRPASSVNVAAILEKANVIRQALQGSDDEEDFS